MENAKTSIVHHQPATPAPFEPENMTQLFDLSNVLAKSSLLPSALRDKPADVAVTLMTGRELGLSPMQSLRGISVIEGKGALNADLMAGLVQSRPSICLYFQLVESDDTKATYETHRKGHRTPTRMTFTIEQAKKAGLLGKKNWTNWPAALLRARCSAHLARAVYPDIVAGIYTEDEADEIRVDAISGGRSAAIEKKSAAKSDAIDGEIVPEHDADTGEVYAEAERDAEEEIAQEEEETLLIEIADAANLDALKALVPRFSTISDTSKTRIREAYGARQRSLRQAEQPAPAVSHEPGSEG